MTKPLAIIGGNPAGLSAAVRVAELGLEVILYEKGEIGSSIKCTETLINCRVSDFGRRTEVDATAAGWNNYILFLKLIAGHCLPAICE